MWLGIVAIVSISGVFAFKSCLDAPARSINAVADNASKNLRALASALLSGSVKTEFREYCTEIHPDLSIQVATLKQVEQFTRTDEATLASIPLPSVVVRVTAPVQYTYSVDLNAQWDFINRDNTLFVICPNPKVGPPAFDVSAMEWEVKKDSILRGSKQVQEDFKQVLMPLAQGRGKSHISTIRETARAQIATFIEQWVAHKYADSSNYRIKVLFASEANRPGANLKLNSITNANTEMH
jgi:hypothetical protein